MKGRSHSFHTSAQRWLDRLSYVFVLIGSVGVLLLMTLTVVGVIWRYILVDPIFGLQDLSSMTAAIVAAAAVAFGATQNNHITVNIMPKHFGRKVRRWTDLIARGVGVIILILAASELIKKGNCGLACGNVTGNLTIPHAPFYYALAIALGFFALTLLVQIARGLVHWAGEDPNEVAE
ncbi:TRAP transporter small permease [Ruegeria sp. HKCCD7255]|uniref:TRAP transporter small permease n=1 Tax=Ruegeria sp. HKCCD7255 TaxID=2683004 RepID=UPI001488E0EB|nr:TRAP transporter small permease subunit [Ruegeria sp. HKCCD7255]